MKDTLTVKTRATWLLTWAALLFFLILPGPAKSPFSGVPLSAAGTALSVMLLGVAVGTLIIRRAKSPRRLWPMVIGIACAAKFLLSFFLITAGWRGYYATGQIRQDKSIEPLRIMEFTTATGPKPFRIDERIDVRKRTLLGADFLNDIPRSPNYETFLRDVAQPLRIVWRGFTWSPSKRTADLTVTASGAVAIRANGQEIYRGHDPRRERVSLPLLEGSRQVEVLYEKAPGVTPMIVLSGAPLVTAMPGDARSQTVSRFASITIDVLGWIALLAFGVALLEAYSPLRNTLATLDAGQVTALLFVATFLIVGLVRTIPQGGTTFQLRIGDDFLNYEGMSRAILRGNVMVTRGQPLGQGEPYYHYPFYPFGLAAAHYLFGDDFVNVILFNCICLAMLGPIMRSFLYKELSPVAVSIALAVSIVFTYRYALPYTGTAYSDNLFLVLMLATLLVSVRALESRRTALFFLTGVLVAISAATRPSAFVYLPFFALLILIRKELGGIAARLKAILATVAGYALAVSPFTIRNKIVSGRWVMLVGGYMSITAFLYPPEGARDVPLLVKGRMPTIAQTLHQVAGVIAADPLGVLWTETRKALFTLGWTGFGPNGSPRVPFFGIYTLLFLASLFAKRIPKTTALVLSSFLLSHLASMILAAPWTYGFKSILPFHLACIVGAAFLMKPLSQRVQKQPNDEAIAAEGATSEA